MNDLFLPPAEPVSYPLHLREPLREDYQRLSALARELGYEPKSAVAYLALEQIVAYRDCLRETRRILADVLAGRGIEWNPDSAAAMPKTLPVSL
jgi:hypothetical protein